MQTPVEERSAGWSSETRDVLSSRDLHPVAWASTDGLRSVNDTALDQNAVVFETAERLRHLRFASCPCVRGRDDIVPKILMLKVHVVKEISRQPVEPRRASLWSQAGCGLFLCCNRHWFSSSSRLASRGPRGTRVSLPHAGGTCGTARATSLSGSLVSRGAVPRRPEPWEAFPTPCPGRGSGPPRGSP